MADKIVLQDPTKPGVLKVLGPTLTSSLKLLLADLDPTGAVNGQGIILAGGVWTPGNPASADTASNLGAGNGVFKSKVAADFQFKTLVAGTNISITNNANDLTLNSTVTSPFSASFTSTAQVITSGGALTLAHGLGTAPFGIQVEAQNITAEHGYTTGQKVQVIDAAGDAATSTGVSVRKDDATSLIIRMGGASNPILVLHATTGAVAICTNANWSLIFKAWK